ncbi:radical SAM/SPASM domain-containing protein [Butyrivibrio sp. FC2001]|uniref:radical SAM/SPASM domain-containing protein n=1 Tax=Butyrivibrio sp. FC2001 TaxID=1280671 RepID=UPI00055FA092|nr:radical SAM protein [Butyrivibrio sp. FC2001]
MHTENLNDIEKQKIRDLRELHNYRQELRKSPQLRRLFFELTLRCNENCVHCGSRCGEVKSPELSKEDYFELLRQIKRDFDQLPMLCITGGEPLLRTDFFEIMEYAKDLGFSWGMTSNGTLIDRDTAEYLKKAGMKTVSISIDGTEKIHDEFRRTKGGFKRAVEGIENLIAAGFDHVQVTTVVSKKNVDILDDIFGILLTMDIDSWRLLGMEPIGRALEHEDLALTMDEHKRLLRYIKDKRELEYPVLYGCSHYLGLEFEREVRDWYFLCNAGLYTASIACNGDIMGCLDIERRPETIQGNIYKDNFKDVWLNRFKIYREPLASKNEKCMACEDRDFCEGGAYHSWDYDLNCPKVCFNSII